jgi:crossover junction endodeoxyribonuclease RuvC
MRILGVDPGTWRTGAGIIEAEGNRYRLVASELIQVTEKKTIADRLRQIYEELTEMIRKYQPDILALENIFFGKDIRAMVKIGEARACAMLAASIQGIEVVEYPPARVKQAVTGNGRATKQQIQRMVKVLLNLDSVLSADRADALAVAICHLHSMRVTVTRDRVISASEPESILNAGSRVKPGMTKNK